MTIDSKLVSWIRETFQYYLDHPDEWPMERETPTENPPFWARLKVDHFLYRGTEDRWYFNVGAFKGPNAEIEMSMMMVDGTREDILSFIRDQLDKGCPKPDSYIFTLCKKLATKDEDDLHDWW